MGEEDAPHFTNPSPKQKANVVFRQVGVTNGRGEGGD